ncbi:tRNA (adenosine(37)-N6)-dimethylallyltransferase MiaA [Castellaniella denitrificans]|uniref:tRNA dimethylallyltransferase n=1 Tax=Castellaniella denitrificans TaxID=56119 RepID=A0ABT4M6H9_9BURK|nr:tRNA (adenosine(37)-N6)-dimethylallyltransferase MiaA [Castellaniella denitrificans]MCZ4329741.1 tRNA (adenosine(37)-N6)-dimethylallyltransferase MiaA [Castellaniella denitrificans]
MNPDHTPLLICLAGPTASGKSAASMALARRWPIEIIVMDSATIYRGMDIGTAKPTAEEQARVPHHLLDIRDPAQAYSAAEFARDAAALARDIRARGRIPLLCGGTMLYYKALREGLNDLPEADPEIRRHLDAQALERGWPALHAELARVDPVTAARLAPHDSQRLQRALEIWHSSGRPMSDWLAQPPMPVLPGWRFETISLEPSDRAVLHARIARRYQAMIAAGLPDEVRSLHARADLHPGLPSIRCVGYRQLWDHLDGRISLDQAIEQAIAATRQLAKRQITWLRSLPQRIPVDCLSDRAAAEITRHCARMLGD